MSAASSGAAFSFGDTGMKNCTVERPNLWTSKGKFFAGDVVELPEEEADALKASGAVSFVRGRKKAETEE